MLSTHKVEVVEVKLYPHPNADTLSLVSIYGYQCIVKTKDWECVTRAAYIVPDSLVDTRLPEFTFLAGDAKYDAESNRGGPYARIRAKKLRGIVSYGLMLPLPRGTELDGDVAEKYGVLHYDPPVQGSGKSGGGFYTSGEVESGPNLFSPKYDVDSFQRYAKQLFVDGEAVHASEKIHGANGRWVYHNERYYCGSRTEWKREYAQIPVPDRADLMLKLIDRILVNKTDAVTDENTKLAGERADAILDSINKKNANPPQNMWWKALRATPELETWLKAHPDVIVYGEVYGAVQNLKYGIPDGQVRIAVFDLLKDGSWVSVNDARKMATELPWVPVVADSMPFDFDKLVSLAEGSTLIPSGSHYREGIVVKPLVERNDMHLGRVQLKIVSPTYLEKS